MKEVRELHIGRAVRRRFLFICTCALCGASLACVVLVGGPAIRVGFAITCALLGLLAVYGSTNIGNRPKAPRAAPAPGELYCPEAAPVRELRGNTKLLFCIHGFPSTPADFRRGMELAASKGWDMVAPLLPGCGTKPEDIVGTDWAMYLEHVRDEWKTIRPGYKTACLLGTSVGGALALALAEEFADDPVLAPSALSTIGTPAVLNSWLRHGVIRSPMVYLARVLGLFAPAIAAGFQDPAREGEDGDGRWKGYVGLYPRQVYSLHVGLAGVERNLHKVVCPVLVMHARHDRVIPHANALVIGSGVSSRVIEIAMVNMDEYGHARHNLLLYTSQERATWDRALDFFARSTAKP